MPGPRSAGAPRPQLGADRVHRGGHGIFECLHTLKDRPVLMRFEWHADPSAPTWAQSFSFADGATRNTNWIMSLDRTA